MEVVSFVHLAYHISKEMTTEKYAYFPSFSNSAARISS